MSTVRYFRWDDPGAPSLTGEVGSLTNLLRKCLVGTAGVAYGSKASAGWSEEFVGAATNTAVFKNNETERGSGCCVRVQDDGSGTAGAREAVLNIYAAMTDINTGSLGSVSTYFRKSATLNSVARPWLVVSDGRTAWVHSWLIGDSSSYSYDNSTSGFGDTSSFLPDENTNRYFIAGRKIENSALGGSQEAFGRSANSSALQVARESGAGMTNGTYLINPFTVTYQAYGSQLFPEITSGDLVLARGNVIYASGIPVGMIRGLLLPLTKATTLQSGDLVGTSGVVVVAGNAYAEASANYEFRAGIDTVGPW